MQEHAALRVHPGPPAPKLDIQSLSSEQFSRRLQSRAVEIVAEDRWLGYPGNRSVREFLQPDFPGEAPKS